MKQTTSILFLTRLYHPSIGGVQKHVEEISKILIKKGFKISIITESFDRSLSLEENKYGIKIYRIPIGKNAFFKKFLIWKWIFLHFNVIWSADIIHVHDVFYWILPFRVFLFFKKIFITFHGYEGFPIKKRWIIQRKISEIFTNGNICVGDFMKKWYKTKPTFVIYGAAALRKNKNLALNSHSAVFFGRLDNQTGILEYEKAYEILKAEYPDFKFTVVGEGELANKLPKGIENEKFTKNITKHIENSRFIFVSRYLSMLEAMSLKKAVIAVYDNEIKKDYLLLSPFKKYVSVAKNEKEIAEFVKFYIKNPKKEKEMLENGFKFSQKQTWEKVVTIYLRLWRLV